MPTFSTGNVRPECIPFQNLGPWKAKLMGYKENPSKDKKNNDGSTRINAFVEFQVCDPRVLKKYPDKPVKKTMVCNAYLYQSSDGKRTSKLFDVFKAISGVAPVPEVVGPILGKEPEANGRYNLTAEDWDAWIAGQFEKECLLMLNPVEERNGQPDQSVAQVLPLAPQDGDAL